MLQKTRLVCKKLISSLVFFIEAVVSAVFCLSLSFIAAKVIVFIVGIILTCIAEIIYVLMG